MRDPALFTTGYHHLKKGEIYFETFYHDLFFTEVKHILRFLSSVTNKLDTKLTIFVKRYSETRITV